MPRPRVAIVGGGIGGLASAWFLQHDHEVTLYEREPQLGGHARTVPVPCDGITVPVETGFKYFMDGSHEVLLGLMRLLDLRPEKRKGSLTIADRVHDRMMLLPPRSPRHLWRLTTGGQLSLALGLRRFMASADRVVAGRDWSVINHVFERDHRVMTEWSGHHLRRPVFRSRVPVGAPEPARVHARKDFQHLLVGRQRAVLQRRLEEGQGLARVWLAGMYTTDVDDHESALLSAVRIARLLAPDSPSLRQLSAVVRARRGLRGADGWPGV